MVCRPSQGLPRAPPALCRHCCPLISDMQRVGALHQRPLATALHRAGRSLGPAPCKLLFFPLIPCCTSFQPQEVRVDIFPTCPH